jgi:orotidine-5'-phosphate decarboxylase
MNAHLDKVIVALDFEYPEQAYRLVDEIGEVIQWFKIGPLLYTQSGTEVIDFLHRRSKKIFLDLKILDTPNVVADTVKQFAGMGVQMATVHCLGGKAMLEMAGHHCRGSQLKLLGVTLLTSQTARDVGSNDKDEDLVVKLVNLAVETRMAGVICSPLEISAVRRATMPGFMLVTPGIRLPGEEVFMDDQQPKRVATPKQAVEWGADFLVIGRPITLAREPREVVKRLFET